MEKIAFSPALLYHAVYEQVPIPLRNRIHNVDPENFLKQMIWLKENFDIVPVDKLPLDGKTGCVSITFDDASASFFSNAIPILNSMSIPATIFPIGGTLSGGLFWRDKLRFIVHLGLESSFIDYVVKYLGVYPDCFNGGILSSTKEGAISDILIDDASDQFMANVIGEIPTLSWHTPASPSTFASESLRFGNHTFYHYRQSILSPEVQKSEIVKGEFATQSRFGSCDKILALPFGRIRDVGTNTRLLALTLGYKMILFCDSSWNGSDTWMKAHALAHLVELNRMKAPNTCAELQKQFGSGFVKSRMKFPISAIPGKMVGA